MDSPANDPQPEAQAGAILLLGRVPFFGGVERVMLDCMEAARSQGHRVLLACPDGGELAAQVRNRGFAVHDISFERMQATANPVVLASYWRSLARVSRSVEDLCRRERVDVLHAHSPVTAMYAVRAVRRLGIPLIMHVHEAAPPKRSYRLAARYSVGAASSIVCVSDAVLRMSREMGFPEQRTALVYNGVSRAFTEGDVTPAADIREPGPRIGCFSVISPNKGQQDFLRAARIVLQSHPTATFYVVGAPGFGTDQAYLETAQRMAEEPPLKGHVVFTGYRQDVPALMAAMDAVALPSTIPESFGLGALEAMALGRKVAAPNQGALPEFIRHRQNGVLFRPCDPEALAEALLWLLDVPEAEGVGPAARRYVRQCLSQDAFAERINAIYGAALAARRGQNA